MKLTVLTDNNTYIDRYYLGEPALCFYIEEEDRRILFDTGYSDVFLKNAAKMGIDLKEISAVAFSHGHNDHTGGLAHLLHAGYKGEVVAHPDTFLRRADATGEIGSPLSEEEVAGKCELISSREPVRLSKDLLWLGEIPETVAFEKRLPIGRVLKNGSWEEDRIYDDTALVYEREDGIFVITGCSHSGICNIIEYARKVTGKQNVLGVIGGFHLLKEDDRLLHTAKWLKDNGVLSLYPCHCVSLAARITLAKEMPIREVAVGMKLDI